ncbi:hypothetical protein Bca52824_081525 [Brassica carinata]|uniref:Uncharacterized protein n=1 Tax=Brassica carinata TaxID=52824 RepID=A0A8X7PFC9_BRACI|nr:hypothetical protein Bca52824_081525 [Brassica carinata]
MVSDISQGKMTVAKYKRFFYSLPIVGERTEQQLILLAKAGLKEEIRDGLEIEEFATLEALFEDAKEVEEGLKETPPSSLANAAAQAPITAVANVLVRRRKKMDTDMDDDASDWTDDTLGSGQFRWTTTCTARTDSSTSDRLEPPPL